jgi:AGZA family xanthine/uracil permease-like MFS transporter
MKENKLSKFFEINKHNSTVNREIMAGITTFAAMSYIIVVQPNILSSVGMDLGALITGTCIASAFACLLMGILANYPIGLAPGMGANFFFVMTIVPACAVAIGAEKGSAEAWQMALGVVLISGIIFALISAAKIRHLLMDAISPSLKYATAGGIGLFIALLGLKSGHIVEVHNGMLDLAYNLLSPDAIIFFIGLVFIAALRVAKVHGAMLYGIGICTIIAALSGEIELSSDKIIGMPHSVAPIFWKADISGVFRYFMELLPLIVVLTFIDMFDTMGTLMGLGAQAGLLKKNKLPRATQAFAADAAATVFGAVCGHSSVTSYIESGAGVEAGGRTGLTAITVGVCFLLALFFSPLIVVIAQYSPITAPALVIVGSLMLHSAVNIDWEDYSEAIPAFLILVGIPFTNSIAFGMLLGFITYPVLKVLTGKAKKISPVCYILAGLLLLYVVFLRSDVIKKNTEAKAPAENQQNSEVIKTENK